MRIAHGYKKTTVPPDFNDRVFKMLEQVVRFGKTTPTNREIGQVCNLGERHGQAALLSLVDAGRIRVEYFGGHTRVITILQGRYSGRSSRHA